MTTYHSEPYKESKRVDLEGYPLLEELTESPYSDSSMPCNDKEHQVYCQHCKYRTLVQGLSGPKCGTCKNYLITITKSRLPDGIVDFGKAQSQD